MEFFVDVAKALVGYVRVNLRGGYTGVAQEGLHRADVRASFLPISQYSKKLVMYFCRGVTALSFVGVCVSVIKYNV